MRWTSVALAVCVLPVLTGCGSLRHGGSPDGDGVHLARRGAGAEAEFRRAAQVAWGGLCARHPRRAFSDEFRDGFVDGYAEYCDRGAACEASPVPPVPYARYKKFFGRGGSHLVRDYYAGFQHGADTAAGPLTAPAAAEPAPRAVPPKPADMPPPKPPATGKFGEPRKSGSDDPPSLAPPPADAPKPIPPLPKPELPVIRPFNPDLSGSKFAPIPVPADPERVPVPFPPLPVAESLVVPLAVPDDAPKIDIPPLLGPLPIPTPVYKVPLPASSSPLDPIPPLPLRYPPK